MNFVKSQVRSRFLVQTILCPAKKKSREIDDVTPPDLHVRAIAATSRHRRLLRHLSWGHPRFGRWKRANLWKSPIFCRRQRDSQTLRWRHLLKSEPCFKTLQSSGWTSRNPKMTSEKSVSHKTIAWKENGPFKKSTTALFSLISSFFLNKEE